MDSALTAATTTTTTIVGGGGSVDRNGAGERRGNIGLGMDNPFSLKIGQVFTGFGVGCGIGIGVGRPVYLGSIPFLQQILSSARGATDVLSGAGRHANSFLRKLGIKNLQAGVGCGIGVGHGFGVGIAIKPSAIQGIQMCLGQAIEKIMYNMGLERSISSIQSVVPGSLQSTHALSGSFDKYLQSYTVNPVQEARQITRGSPQSDSLVPVSKTISDSKEKSPETPVVRHSETVISSFLKNTNLIDEKEMEVHHLAEKLKSENDVLQVLLRHHQVISKLVEENEKLRQILIEDLKISPNKLGFGHENWSKFTNACSDCFECRRKRSRR